MHNDSFKKMAAIETPPEGQKIPSTTWNWGLLSPDGEEMVNLITTRGGDRSTAPLYAAEKAVSLPIAKSLYRIAESIFKMDSDDIEPNSYRSLCIAVLNVRITSVVEFDPNDPVDLNHLFLGLALEAGYGHSFFVAQNHSIGIVLDQLKRSPIGLSVPQIDREIAYYKMIESSCDRTTDAYAIKRLETDSKRLLYAAFIDLAPLSFVSEEGMAWSPYLLELRERLRALSQNSKSRMVNHAATISIPDDLELEIRAAELRGEPLERGPSNLVIDYLMAQVIGSSVVKVTGTDKRVPHLIWDLGITGSAYLISILPHLGEMVRKEL